jgi:hypothetical protein
LIPTRSGNKSWGAAFVLIAARGGIENGARSTRN